MYASTFRLHNTEDRWFTTAQVINFFQNFWQGLVSISINDRLSDNVLLYFLVINSSESQRIHKLIFSIVFNDFTYHSLFITNIYIYIYIYIYIDKKFYIRKSENMIVNINIDSIDVMYTYSREIREKKSVWHDDSSKFGNIHIWLLIDK